MNLDEYAELAEKLIPVVQEAGRVEMEVYHQEFEVETKSDASPVTIADRKAEAVILKALAAIAPQIPVVAEEAASEGRVPEIAERFFLVDPLDGTKEFIQKSHEFTVNIALVERGCAVFGIVFAPALQELYLTVAPEQAVYAKIPRDGGIAQRSDLDLAPIKTRTAPQDGLTVLASKSHMTDETLEYIKAFQVKDLKSAGSSLKFCLLAKGEADLYPRFGPTMEWDSAAGHAILSAAGGQVIKADASPLLYGNVDQKFCNPSFIAWGGRPISPDPLG